MILGHEPSAEQKACQAPKPILLNCGFYDWPGPWEPAIVPIQLFRLGQLVIVGVPGEFSTMAGRRLRDTVAEAILAVQPDQAPLYVVIAGLSNEYTHYITTYEEYQVQRYEGASTLYGPHTLDAYLQEFSALATALASGSPVPPGPIPGAARPNKQATSRRTHSTSSRA